MLRRLLTAGLLFNQTSANTCCVFARHCLGPGYPWLVPVQACSELTAEAAFAAAAAAAAAANTVTRAASTVTALAASKHHPHGQAAGGSNSSGSSWCNNSIQHYHSYRHSTSRQGLPGGDSPGFLHAPLAQLLPTTGWLHRGLATTTTAAGTAAGAVEGGSKSDSYELQQQDSGTLAAYTTKLASNRRRRMPVAATPTAAEAAAAATAASAAGALEGQRTPTESRQAVEPESGQTKPSASSVPSKTDLSGAIIRGQPGTLWGGLWQPTKTDTAAGGLLDSNQAAAAAAAAEAEAPAAIAGKRGSGGRKQQQQQQHDASGLLHLCGTEEQLFSQVLEYVPPQAAAELAEVAQIANRHRDKRRLPTYKLLEAISKVLDLTQQFPDLQLAPLLQPVIAAARTRYSLDALVPKVKRMRRVLPDTQLREALMSRDPADVSRTVSKAVSAFMEVLSMQPPTQLLCAPRAFVGTLSLAPDSLKQHLTLLKQSVSSLEVAHQLARRNTATLLMPYAERLLMNSEDVAQLLNISQDDAVALILRHPHLASTTAQLSLLRSMVQDLPARIGIKLQQLQSLLVQRPNSARYRSPEELAAKVDALEPHFPGAPRADILAVCSYARVMRGPTVKVIASLRTCATVMGYDNPAPLLPLLLQLTTPTETDESTAEATPTGLSKRPHAYLLLPAEQLASRAVQLQQLYGLSREQLARLARQFPQTVFAKSSSTTKLKALLLQLQLLGDGSCAAGDRLAPDIQKLFKKCPQLSNLKHQTCLDHLSQLQQLLQLSPSQGTQLVMRLPQLLLYAPSKLDRLFERLAELAGSRDKAQAIVMQSPQVLLQLARLEVKDGQLPVVRMVDQLIKQQQQQQEEEQQQEQLRQQQSMNVSDAAIDAAHERVQQAVQAAAAAAEQQVRSDSSGGTSSSSGNYRGVRRRFEKWEMRYAGRSHYYLTQVEAACAYDLTVLAAATAAVAAGKSNVRRGLNALNFPAVLYSSEAVLAVAEYVQLRQVRQQKQQQHPQQQQQQQQEQRKHTDGQPEDSQQQQQQQDVTSSSAAGPGVEELPGVWGTARQLLLSPTGRVLLNYSTQAAQARLQTLAELTGLTIPQVLSRFLAGSSYYTSDVLQLSPGRMEAAAARLQQLLQLSHADLQLLLRKAPILLAYKADSMSEKVAVLVPAVQSCAEAVAVYSAISSSSSKSGCSGQPGRWAMPGFEGLICLQRAALSTPAVLMLSNAKVVQRLAVLQRVCVQAGMLGQQLQAALSKGAVGMWLTAGDAHYQKLEELAAVGSPLLQQLRLGQFFRQPPASPSHRLSDIDQG